MLGFKFASISTEDLDRMSYRALCRVLIVLLFCKSAKDTVMRFTVAAVKEKELVTFLK